MIRGLYLAFVLLAICGGTALWLRADRSFSFVSKYQGRIVPYPLRHSDDKELAIYDERARHDTKQLYYGLTGDPKQIKADIDAELKANGWHDDEGMPGIYLRADFQDGGANGIPMQTFSNLTDSAVFEDNPKVLNLPKGMTCVFSAPRKSNFAELTYRWSRRKRDEVK